MRGACLDVFSSNNFVHCKEDGFVTNTLEKPLNILISTSICARYLLSVADDVRHLSYIIRTHQTRVAQPSNMSPSALRDTLTAVPINLESNNELNRFIDIIVHAFSTTPLTTGFIANIDSTPPPYPSPLIDSARRHKHFAQGIIDSAESGAEIVQAGDWSAVALWESPDYKGKPFIDSKAKPGPLLGEWRTKVTAAKKKYLASPTDPNEIRPFYHFSFLARNTAVPKVAGSIAAVIEPYLQRARDDNAPAWVEATTKQAADIYAFYGFRLVETITIGKGQVDAAGWPSEGGEGITAYALIYDTHLKD